MANDIITTLHPDNDQETNLYPNIKKENIPNGSIDNSKLADGSINPTKLDGGNLVDIINEWLDDHPEATTSVEDGSIGQIKLSDDIHQKDKIAIVQDKFEDIRMFLSKIYVKGKLVSQGYKNETIELCPKM